MDPTTQALMAAGLGLLGTRGSAGFGRAGLMGLNQLEAAKKMKLLEEESRQREAERQSIAEMRAAQVQQMQAALAEAQRKQAQAGQIQQAARDSMMGPAGVAMAGGGGPTVANAAKMDALPQGTRVMDEQGFADRVFEIDPMSGLALRQQMRERNAPVKLSKDDRLIDPTTRQELVGAVPAQSEFERVAAEQYGKGTPAYQQAMRNYLLTKSTHAPGTSVSVNAFEPAAVALQKEMATNLAKQADTLQSAPVALANIKRAKELVKDSGGFVGSFADQKIAVAKFLNNNLGMSIDPNGVASAEELRSRIFFNVMDNLKKLDAQPSQLQQKIMMESLGQLGTDPTALPRVLDAFAETIRGKVSAHNKRATEAMSRGVPMFFDPRVSLPDDNDSALGGAPRVIEWNSLPGGR